MEKIFFPKNMTTITRQAYAITSTQKPYILKDSFKRITDQNIKHKTLTFIALEKCKLLQLGNRCLATLSKE